MRTKLLVATVLGAVVVALVVALVTRDPRPQQPGRPDGSDAPGGAGGSRSELLTEVHARFDPEHPGRGVIDYPGESVEDIPKSYAMIVLADLERRRHGIRTDLPDLVDPAGRWLLEHATESEDGTVGWGLPVAWDAYGEGSENPAGTIYSISTGIAADALLTWMENDPEAPGKEILETVGTALDNFARAPRTPDGLIPYSLEAADRPYDTFNSAAYVAGQMQRFAAYADTALARRLTEAADATVDSLVRNHRTSPDDHWYWRYSLQETNANDMPHASYIIDGLRTYVRAGGALAERVDLPRVLGHLEEYVDDAGSPRAWPALQEEIDRPPRLYDVGMALSLACSEPTLAGVADTLLPTIDSYRAPDGSGFLKFPVGTPDQDALVVNEYEAYLWRGLVACTTDELAGAGGDAAGAGRQAVRRSPVAAAPGTEVPFVRIGEGAGRVSFTDSRTSFEHPGSPGRRVEEDGLVLRALDDGAGGVLLVREFPRNDLHLVALSSSGSSRQELDVRVSDDSAPILRAALVHDGVLHVVAYDNPTLANYLFRFERGPDGYAPIGEPLRLPSVEDPSGGTYEMVPPVFLAPAGGELHVVAGTLSASVDANGTLTEERLPNCLRAVEAVATPEGPVVLCQQAEEGGPGAPFELHGPSGMDLPSLDGDGVPFGLDVADGEVAVRFADSPTALADMLRADLERTDGGWLEYGTDNVEGRVAWSQSYYLNGFLDFLLLASDDDRRWEALADVLGGMRTRLDQEVALADQQWRDGGYETRAFTVDRSLALFAVQTSRLLLLEHRYSDEVARPAPLPGRARLRTAVTTLSDHIEVRRDAGQQPWWWPEGVPYLAWPQGSAFSYDGLNVPYNHQNEWAYAVTRAGAGARAGDARAIVAQFLRRVAPDGRLPLRGSWDYWWGQAWDGWTEADDVSDNTPAYDGDHIAAAKSFRSIDAMSALATAPALDPTARAHLYASTATLVAQDHLYPFVSHELRRAGVDVRLPDEVVRRYLRISSPWEVQSAAWAYDAELERLAR